MYAKQTMMVVCGLLLAGSATAQQHADCVSAKKVCSKDPIRIARTGGEGRDRLEADFVACFMNGDNFGMAEENSTWFTWQITQGGSLTFTITPTKKENDMDFVVYRLAADGSCRGKQIVRCMAAGDPPERYGTSPCLGPTGLRDGETDTSEDAGCSDPGDNAWLAPLKTVKGEHYALLVSNVSEAGPGFTLTFGGTARIGCEEEAPPVSTAPPPKPPKQPEPVQAPKPVAPVADAPVPTAAMPPKEIGGRTVEVKQTFAIKTRKITLKIWDSQIEDGDVVSVYVNDKKVLDRISLTVKPRTFEMNLPEGREHFITVYADDFGRAEPNTARVEISDGTQTHTIDLVATRSKQQSIKLVLD
jgi:hypothetical protein